MGELLGLAQPRPLRDGGRDSSDVRERVTKADTSEHRKPRPKETPARPNASQVDNLSSSHNDKVKGGDINCGDTFYLAQRRDMAFQPVVKMMRFLSSFVLYSVFETC